MARALSTKAALGAALSLLTALACVRAEAQDAGDVAVDPFTPPPDQAGFTTFSSTRTPGPWGVDGTLWLDYGFHPYQRRGPDPIQHRLSGTVAAQLGVLSRGAIALRMPMTFVQRGERAPGEPSLTSVAAGNPAIDGRIRLLGAPVRPDGSVQDGSALALRGVVHVPVGTSDAYFADGKWRTELDAIADIELFGIGAGVSLGWVHRYDGDAPDDYAQAHMLRLSTGLRLPLPLISRLLPGRVQESALLEVAVGTPARDFFAKAKTPVELRAGYRVVMGDLTGTLALGAGLTDGVGAADFRAIVGLGWSPRQHDQDADGVPDGADKCVHLPEDRDGFEDGDGCADDDNDGDLIVDEDDRCPLEAAEMDRDEDEDGCTDPDEGA